VGCPGEEPEAGETAGGVEESESECVCACVCKGERPKSAEVCAGDVEEEEEEEEGGSMVKEGGSVP
jgi:hypothetical protein